MNSGLLLCIKTPYDQGLRYEINNIGHNVVARHTPGIYPATVCVLVPREYDASAIKSDPSVGEAVF